LEGAAFSDVTGEMIFRGYIDDRTPAVVASTPDIYAAAVAIVVASNLITLLEAVTTQAEERTTF
jgi:hypothetical protein